MTRFRSSIASRLMVLALILAVPAPLSLRAQVPAEARGFSGASLHLYPLGWSSEGRWGALIGFESGSSGPRMELVVIDAVTDEVLHRSDSLDWAGPDAFDSFWSRYSRMVTETVDSYGLETTLKPDVRDGRFITGGVEYEFIMDPPSPADGRYSLRITSSRGDIKDVYSSPGDASPRRSVLLGAMVSPFEKRALAIIREIPPYGRGETSYRFSGAHLTLGFSSRGTSTEPEASGGSVIAAVFNGQTYLVRARLSAGGNPDEQDERGYPAVLVAARLGHWPIVIDLLAAGASPLPRDADGRSALHHAAFAGDADAVSALLAAGADRAARDGAGRTPAELAADATLRARLR